MIDRLDEFMGCPAYDPHGDPIPNNKGQIINQQLQPALQLSKHQSGIIAGVADHSPAFLQYLEKTQLIIGETITVTDLSDYDISVSLKTTNKEMNISREVAKNILIAI
ncbi:metal-dependent transcriptional regulator [Mucilaginibacter galii]|uniref:metal-dependent transcriptional regulator n=1 Tax=Mucilaginibacter galii TaxID=2005073 RepID=UPI0036409586